MDTSYILLIILIVILVALLFGYYYFVYMKRDNNTNFCYSSQSNQVYPEKPILESERIEENKRTEQKDTTNEVFNIENNIFTYYDAPAICKAYGAELASFEQVKKAYNKGASWCNYGWTKGQMALYPTQYDNWKKLQQGPPEYRKVCGRPGLNGGYFENPNLKFGVNCYGIKPKAKEMDHCDNDSLDFNSSMNEKVENYRRDIQDYKVLPFNKKEWNN